MSEWTRPEPGSGRVLFPPDIDVRESMMGLVLKTASDNMHSNVGGILLAAEYPHARSFALAQTRFERLPDLARVLGVRKHDLQELVHPELRSTKTLRTVRFLGAEVPDYDLITMRRRVAPTTLADSHFHRSCWTHGLLPYCPISLELLRDTCPACRTPLGWYRANGIAGCSRKGCGFDLRDNRSERMDDVIAPAYQRMAALAAPKDAIAQDGELAPSLARLNPGIVFELGWRLASIFDSEGVPRPEARHLPPTRIVQTLVVADDILKGWPARFEVMLEEHRLAMGTKAVSEILKRLRSTASITTGWTEIGGLLHETFPHLLCPGRQALRSLDPTVVTGTTANAMIGMSANRFAAVKRAMVLDTVAEIGNKRAFHDFDITVVAALADAKDGSIPARSVCERFGIAFHGVEQLVALDTLEEEPHPALQAFRPQLRVTRRSVDALVGRLAAASDASLADTIPIRHAIKSLAGEKPWAAIVEAMLAGRLSYHIEEGPSRLFQRIHIDAHQMSSLGSMSFDRKSHPSFQFAEDMAKRDAEEALNLNPALLPKALHEEIGSRADDARVTVADVIRISRQRISPAEICARTSPGGRRLPPSLKRARLIRVGVAGWNREEVEPILPAR